MKTREEMVSIVMPLYNHERYVQEAIQSVLDQKHANFELFVIDDCSTDQSANKASEIKDDRLKLLRHSKNLGTSATINEGISLAQGEYVSIINSDDIYHADRLERLFQCCMEREINLIGTTVVLVDENSREIQADTHWWKEWYNDLLRHYRESGNVYRSLLRGNFYISSSNFFFKKSLVGQIGNFRPLRYTPDYEFLFRSVKVKTGETIFLDEPLLYYRLHKSNSIGADPLEANRETFDLLIEQGNDSGELIASALLFQHLQKIRQYIEAEYQADIQRSSIKVADAKRENSALMMNLQQIKTELQNEKNQTNELQVKLQRIEGELQNAKVDMQSIEEQMKFLRTEIAKISSTKGYRMEKGLYEMYMKIRHMILLPKGE